MADHQTVLFASFDTSQFLDPESNYINYSNDNRAILNPTPATIYFSICARDVEQITPDINFTSNGVDGFGDLIDTFNIPAINFTNQKIYFIARYKEGVVPFKREPLIQSTIDFLITQNTSDTIRIFNSNNESVIINEGDLTLSLMTSNSSIVPEISATFESNFSNISGTAGGFFKGYLTSTLTGEDMRIRIIYDSSTLSETFTSYSTPFNIYSANGVYDIRKDNEDNNQTLNYKNLIYQDVLLNKPQFFDNLLGQSVGNNNSSTDTLGIKMFEKTTNFVSNIADIDYCNLKALISMLNSLDIDFEEYNQQFPPTLQRLVDILSVNFSRQVAKKNEFQLNFDDKGFTSKTIFGKNKGDNLPIDNTILYTGSQSRYIIAYEKFSENYTLVNTNILSATEVDYKTINSYPLSSYNNSWGWGLVVPKDVNGVDIEPYYEFYDYNNTVDGTLIADFIDYTNSNCTYLQTISSYNEIVDKDGVADSLIQYNLYSSCGLISGTEYND
tara:strand:- start:2958 stop:4457 length:1500 start_codon:yes stop_codon:yes gene_type:complete